MTNFLTKKELLKRIPYSDQHILRMEKTGQFPLRCPLGPGRVGWDEAEVEAWVQSKKEARNGGPIANRVMPPRAASSR